MRSTSGSMRPITDSMRRVVRRAASADRRAAVWLVVVLWAIAAAIFLAAA